MTVPEATGGDRAREHRARARAGVVRALRASGLFGPAPDDR